MDGSLQPGDRRGSASVRRWRNALVLALGDLGALTLALVAGRALIYTLSGGPVLPRYSLLLLPAWCIGAAAVDLLPAWGLGPVEEMRRIQLLLISVFAAGGMAYFFGPGLFYPSRLSYVVSWLTAAAAVPAARALVRALVGRAGAWGCPVVIYGDRATIETVAEAFRRGPAIGYRPVGVFTDEAAPGDRVAALPVLGSMQERDPAAEVAIAPMMLAEQPALAERYDQTLGAYRHVLLLPDVRESVFLWVRPRALGDVLAMEITGNLLKLAQSFNRLCGRPLETPFAPAAPFTLEPRSETGETLLQRARVERMDYRQLRRQEQLADLQLRLVRCGDKPSVVFSFAYEVRNGVMPDVGRLRGSWSAVLSATYPLFDGFRTRAQVSAADSGRRAAQKRLVDLEQSMTAEIAGLLTDLQTIEQKLTVEQEKIRHAEKALRIADERHKTGLISVTDLIEAQNTLENARLNRLQLTYNHILTRFQLDRASGRKLHP